MFAVSDPFKDLEDEVRPVVGRALLTAAKESREEDQGFTVSVKTRAAAWAAGPTEVVARFRVSVPNDERFVASQLTERLRHLLGRDFAGEVHIDFQGRNETGSFRRAIQRPGLVRRALGRLAFGSL